MLPLIFSHLPGEVVSANNRYLEIFLNRSAVILLKYLGRRSVGSPRRSFLRPKRSLFRALSSAADCLGAVSLFEG